MSDEYGTALDRAIGTAWERVGAHRPALPEGENIVRGDAEIRALELIVAGTGLDPAELKATCELLVYNVLEGLVEEDDGAAPPLTAILKTAVLVAIVGARLDPPEAPA